MKNKILPINKNPLVKTYTYYGFINAILSADYCKDGSVAEIELDEKNTNKDNWKQVYEDLECVESGSRLRFLSNNTYNNMNGCWYRPLEEDDKICINLYSQLETQPWGAVNLFISDLSDESIMDDNAYLYRLGRFQRDGVYLRVNNVQESFPQLDFHMPMSLSLEKKGDEIVFSYQSEDGEWEILKKEFIKDWAPGKFNIGFQIKQNDSAYYNWLCSNFIQMSFELTNPFVKLNYFFGLSKNWQYFVDNYFIAYHVVKKKELKKWGIDLLDYIKENIENGVYMECWMNHYFIKSRSEYQKRTKFHQYLIYGYSDETEELNVLGYNDTGRMMEDVIKYQDFLSEDNNCSGYDFIASYEKQMDGNFYELDVSYICEMIEQYLQSKDSSACLQHIFPRKNLTYGVNIYDELITDDGLEAVLYDRRITHLIYEHKECMKTRMKYMIAKGILKTEECDSLLEQIELLIKETKNLRNISLRYTMGEFSKEKYEDIKERICVIKTHDVAFMEDFLAVLYKHA